MLYHYSRLTFHLQWMLWSTTFTFLSCLIQTIIYLTNSSQNILWKMLTLRNEIFPEVTMNYSEQTALRTFNLGCFAMWCKIVSVLTTLKKLFRYQTKFFFFLIVCIFLMYHTAYICCFLYWAILVLLLNVKKFSDFTYHNRNDYDVIVICYQMCKLNSGVLHAKTAVWLWGML